jgi:hypothetical protein
MKCQVIFQFFMKMIDSFVICPMSHNIPAIRENRLRGNFKAERRPGPVKPGARTGTPRAIRFLKKT